MIPRTAILCYIEFIHVVIARSYWALSNAVHPISLHPKPLAKPMPMDTGAIGGELVVNGYDNSLFSSPTVSRYNHLSNKRGTKFGN
jgi:hypothetical protein